MATGNRKPRIINNNVLFRDPVYVHSHGQYFENQINGRAELSAIDSKMRNIELQTISEVDSLIKMLDEHEEEFYKTTGMKPEDFPKWMEKVGLAREKFIDEVKDIKFALNGATVFQTLDHFSNRASIEQFFGDKDLFTPKTDKTIQQTLDELANVFARQVKSAYKKGNLQDKTMTEKDYLNCVQELLGKLNDRGKELLENAFKRWYRKNFSSKPLAAIQKSAKDIKIFCDKIEDYLSKPNDQRSFTVRNFGDEQIKFLRELYQLLPTEYKKDNYYEDTLAPFYSRFGFVYEQLAGALLAETLSRNLEGTVKDLELEFISLSSQQEVTNDFNIYMPNDTKVGVSVKSSVNNKFYVKELDFLGRDLIKEKYYGSTTVPQLLYLVMNYDALSKFSVETDGEGNETQKPKSEYKNYEENLVNYIRMIAYTKALLGSLFVSVTGGNKDDYDQAIRDLDSWPVFIFMGNAQMYSTSTILKNLMKAIVTDSIGRVDVNFIKNPQQLWDIKKEFIYGDNKVGGGYLALALAIEDAMKKMEIDTTQKLKFKHTSISLAKYGRS